MDKRCIVLLVIAFLIIITSILLGDWAKGQYSKAWWSNSNEHRFTPYITLSKIMLYVGIISGFAGAIWLIVSSINKNQASVSNSQQHREMQFCSKCGCKHRSDISFCPECGHKIK